MSSVIISGDTSGSITLAAPAVAGTNTITLPASTGTMLTTTSPKAGNVIQVVNATYSTPTTNSTNTWADTGLSATITPSSTSSKILIIGCVNGISKFTTDTNAGIRLLNGSTVLKVLENIAGYTSNSTPNAIGGCAITFLHSPASVSAQTYKFQFNSGSNTAVVYVQDTNGTSSITLMEIAG
jgi:hypothetical protein